jgi:hypothetical protein
MMARGASADACVEGAYRVAVSVDGGSDRLRAAVREEIISELERARICTLEKEGTAPIARIHVTLRQEASATVHVDDAVTKKILEREVSVVGLPADGRALPIAIAADELLRASWAEISIHPKDDVPTVVRESVAPAQSPSAPPTVSVFFERAWEVGLRTTVGVYGGGQTQLGGALFLRRDLGRRVTVEMFGYGREGMVVNAADGAIHAHAVGGGFSLDLHLFGSGAARVGLRGGADLGYVSFVGTPREGALSSTFGGLSSFAQAGLVGGFEADRLRLSASLLGLAPIRQVQAIDGAAVVTSLGGPGIQAGIGAGVGF